MVRADWRLVKPIKSSEGDPLVHEAESRRNLVLGRFLARTSRSAKEPQEDDGANYFTVDTNLAPRRRSSSAPPPTAPEKNTKNKIYSQGYEAL